ncbi:cytochrome c oxidase subunit VIII [Pichia kluyveri]|uniref:Cytochrome c oxidase subunit 8, mitochondrial n=1 Tax=Pichia kluyveri TaxID=36015 RepID=A0AAV5QWL7_PICKL|nr:cytochrome c oxidase subunit VIII [Pichia kluyveri]
MFAQLSRSIRPATKSSARTFTSSSKNLSSHFPEGAYNNLPFKVKNRRVPYAIPHIIFWVVGAGIPFFAVCVQQKRAGLL